jgi:uncharacterized lipoprotein NlpE involved in copper resistance
MKKTIFSLSILIFILILSSCNSTNKKTSLEGIWKKANVENDNCIVTFKGNTWQYFKNNEFIEKGTFIIKNDQLILSEEVNEASHNTEKSHGHEHGHSHEYDHDSHCEKMTYKYLLNDTELKLMQGKRISMYNKIK